MLSGFAESLSDSLGIREGLAEFRGQLCKDGRAIAEEKGVDLSKLDALEDRFASKQEELCSAAISALTKDETLAQLLDLKPAGQARAQPHGDALEHGSAGIEAPEDMMRPAALAAGSAVADGCAAGQALSPGPAEVTAGSSRSAVVPPEVARPAGVGMPSSSALSAGADAADAGRAPGSEVLHDPVAATRASRPAASEAEVQRFREAAESAESELSKAKAQLQALEARCAELSAISDDALSQTEALRRESCSWQERAEEEQKRLQAAELERVRLAEALAEAQRAGEAPAEEPRAQELAAEVAYLRKALDAREQRLREATEERQCLQQRDLASKAAARDPEHGLLLEAHTAIAAAFGDSLSAPPLVRFIDEPLLRFTAVLFKQSFFRRAFYASTALIWIFALHHIIIVPHS